MDNDVKNNIFYRPDLDIERSYQTTGSILKTTPIEVPASPKQTTELEDILERAKATQEELLRIRKITDAIPIETAVILNDIIEKEIFQGIDNIKQIEELIEQDKIDEEEQSRVSIYEDNTHTSEPEEVADEEENKVESEEDLFWKDPEPLDLTISVVKCKEPNSLAEEQYIKDIALLREDFAFKLRSVMEEYIYPLYTVMGETGLDSLTYLNLNYEGETVSGVKLDEKHLHDIIVKNQVLIDEKNRKFAKTHSTNNTIATMMALDVVSQERVKYYAENYDVGLNTFAGIFKRNYLEEIRREYEKKYFKAKVNMYRYLNSSLTISSDILKKTLETQVAKCYLLTKDVNIYARKDYEETAYENTTDNTMVDLDKNETTEIKPTADKNTKKEASSSSSKSSSINDKIDNALSSVTKKLKL